MVSGCWAELWSWKNGRSAGSASSRRAYNQILGLCGGSFSALGAVWRWELKNLSGEMGALQILNS